jgi:hypothetical protein
MKGFAKRRDRHRPLAQLRMRQHAGVPFGGKADMLIDLIAEHIDFTFGNRLPQRGKILALPDRRRRVVRRIEDHQPGFVAQLAANCCQSTRKCGGCSAIRFSTPPDSSTAGA